MSKVLSCKIHEYFNLQTKSHARQLRIELLNLIQGKDNTSWIPNSGVGFYVTCEPLNIKQKKEFDGPDQIFIGNGAALSISSVGSSLFVSPYDSIVLFQLNHLLHVSSITKISLSVC